MAVYNHIRFIIITATHTTLIYNDIYRVVHVLRSVKLFIALFIAFQ